MARAKAHPNLLWFLLALAAGFSLCLALPGSAAPSHTVQPPTSCPGERYPDVCPSDWFYGYVTDLTGVGAIGGYADGTFGPVREVTRGQTMKIVVIATGVSGATPLQPTFEDVSVSQPFFQWIEIGAAHGLIGGYACGGAFEQAILPAWQPGQSRAVGEDARNSDELGTTATEQPHL